MCLEWLFSTDIKKDFDSPKSRPSTPQIPENVPIEKYVYEKYVESFSKNSSIISSKVITVKSAQIKRRQ